MRNIVVYHITDIHLSIKKPFALNNFFKSIGMMLMNGQPDIVVISGDICDGHNNESPELYNLAFKTIHEEFPKAKIIATPGNHDNLIAFQKSVDENKYVINPFGVKDLIFEGTLFRAINTVEQQTATSWYGLIKKNDVDFFKECSRNTVIIGHHPIAIYERQGLLSELLNSDLDLDEIKKSKAMIYMSGHVHLNSCIQINNTLHLLTTSTETPSWLPNFGKSRKRIGVREILIKRDDIYTQIIEE